MNASATLCRDAPDDVVTSAAGLSALAPGWWRLWRRTPAATPFQSPAWLLPWWERFGTAHPVVAVAHDGAQLSGILPMYVLEDAEGHKLLPVGVGLTDYCDALIAPDAPPETAERLLSSALRAGAALGAVLCDLADVPPQSPLRSSAAPEGWRAAWRIGDACPVLTAPPGARGVLDAVPASQRRKLRMNRHRADREGGWRFAWADPGSRDGAMARLLRWSAHRWNGMDPAAISFHAHAAAALQSSGLLRLGVLRIREQDAACCYAFTAGSDRLFFYLIGFDPALGAMSPGSLLIGAMIDAAISEGRRELHFLRGDEAYKRAWGALPRHNAACRLRHAATAVSP